MDQMSTRTMWEISKVIQETESYWGWTWIFLLLNYESTEFMFFTTFYIHPVMVVREKRICNCHNYFSLPEFSSAVVIITSTRFVLLESEQHPSQFPNLSLYQLRRNKTLIRHHVWLCVIARLREKGDGALVAQDRSKRGHVCLRLCVIWSLFGTLGSVTSINMLKTLQGNTNTHRTGRYLKLRGVLKSVSRLTSPQHYTLTTCGVSPNV